MIQTVLIYPMNSEIVL